MRAPAWERSNVSEHCTNAGSTWPAGPAAQFQSHQQACMNGFQTFLGQDAPRAVPMPVPMPMPRAATAAAQLAPTRQEGPAEQDPRPALPVAPMEPEQEPRQLLASSAGNLGVSGLPSMLRPRARTASVPLTGLYAQVWAFVLSARSPNLSAFEPALRMLACTARHFLLCRKPWTI